MLGALGTLETAVDIGGAGLGLRMDIQATSDWNLAANVRGRKDAAHKLRSIERLPATREQDLLLQGLLLEELEAPAYALPRKFDSQRLVADLKAALA
jgi:hypothetical protein